MENNIIISVISLFIVIQVLGLLIGVKWHNERVLAYRTSIIMVCIYNVDLLLMELDLGRLLGILSTQLLPILSLLVFRSIYNDFNRCVEVKPKESMGYFFVNLIPFILGFVLVIDFLRMLLNAELVGPSIDVFHQFVVSGVILYQLLVLVNLLFANIKFYRVSIARYGQVFLAHILINSVYIAITFIVLILNRAATEILMTGLLFSLYVSFMVVNHVKSEWLPHSSTKPLALKQAKNIHAGQQAAVRDRRSLDSLTGVFTRTYFFSHLSQLDVNDDSLGIVLMDVSGLKLVNESFGYHIGDEILLEMSVVLSDTFTNASIARISGRIFAVLISGESESKICDKIRVIKSLADQKHTLDVQLNFGYYIRGHQDIDAMDLYKRAEEELYYNRMLVNQKHQGKLAEMLYNNYKNFLPDLTLHLKNCQRLIVDFASYLNLDKERIENLANAALIHDIALVNMPRVVGLEMSFADDFQKRQYINHVEKGYEIAIETGLNNHVARTILNHHEKVDGTGFPNQLQGDQIPEDAQLLSLIDFVEMYIRDRGSDQGLVTELKEKIEVAFSEKIVYNMIAFLESDHYKGENYEFD